MAYYPRNIFACSTVPWTAFHWRWK